MIKYKQLFNTGDNRNSYYRNVNYDGITILIDF